MGSFSEKKGDIAPAVNQATDTFPNISEILSSCLLENFLFLLAIILIYHNLPTLDKEEEVQYLIVKRVGGVLMIDTEQRLVISAEEIERLALEANKIYFQTGADYDRGAATVLNRLAKNAGIDTEKLEKEAKKLAEK